MYGKPFNPKRPFGEVFGVANHAYEQDGQRFNAQKQPVDENGRLMPLAPKAPVPAEPAPETLIEDDPDIDTPEDEKRFDLHAWAMGDPSLAGTPWQTVRAASAEVLGDITELKSKEALRKALREHFQIT